MRISWYVFCFSLLFCALLGDCFGVAFVPKDKRGWTLNSAGYLLGPPLLPSHSPLPKADAHQTLPDKGALAGKRDAAEDLYSVGQESVAPVLQPSDYSILQTLMDFLSYLNLRDQRVIGRLPLQMSEESMQQ
ncbi:galanin peptides-like [Protobothrops mucrosquamatus]|uniref:galanin peptides-like n=1 Tax=Protobothrops mucrosquamatus TaxID=103944 RepID=UPI0010FB8A34|nr:galanin peptides-like [Protobothrops mucrosquamatus]